MKYKHRFQILSSELPRDFYKSKKMLGGVMQPNGLFMQTFIFFLTIYPVMLNGVLHRDSSRSEMQGKTGTRLAYFDTAQLVE